MPSSLSLAASDHHVNIVEMFGSAAPMLLLLGVVLIGIKLLKHPSVKGMIGEAAVNWAGLARLDKTKYKVLKNVFIPSLTSEGMTEIDHLVVSAHGIFVIETKNYSGWIFGGEHDHKWTVAGSSSSSTRSSRTKDT